MALKSQDDYGAGTFTLVIKFSPGEPGFHSAAGKGLPIISISMAKLQKCQCFLENNMHVCVSGIHGEKGAFPYTYAIILQ